MAIQDHPRSTVLVPIESMCATSYINSKFLGPILPRFMEIAGFLLRTATQPVSHPDFAGVPLGLDCRCWGYGERRP